MSGPEAGRAETELVLRCLEGDRAAFDTLVQRHYRGIYAMLHHMSGSEEDASDLTQETFLRAYARLETFQLGRPFAAWVRRIATNIYIEQGRKRKVPALSLEQAVEVGKEPADRSPANFAGGVSGKHRGFAPRAARGAATTRNAARDRRAPASRRALPGGNRRGRCGMPLGTVKVNLFRARRRVRASGR